MSGSIIVLVAACGIAIFPNATSAQEKRRAEVAFDRVYEVHLLQQFETWEGVDTAVRTVPVISGLAAARGFNASRHQVGKIACNVVARRNQTKEGLCSGLCAAENPGGRE
eukprot:6491140-Amphidinium_carterae.3